MPIQFPKTFISSNGVHYLDGHVQYVFVNVTDQNPPTDIYLPAAGVVAAPIKIYNTGSAQAIPENRGIRILPQSGKTIGGALVHKMPSSVLMAQSYIEVIPAIGPNGAITGNWWLSGGNAAQLFVGAFGLSVADSGITEVATVVPVHDSCDSWVAGLSRYRIFESGLYEITATLSAATLAADKTVWLTMNSTGGFVLADVAIEGVNNGGIWSGTVRLPAGDYTLGLTHNDSGNKTINGLLQVRRIT